MNNQLVLRYDKIILIVAESQESLSTVYFVTWPKKRALYIYIDALNNANVPRNPPSKKEKEFKGKRKS